MKKITFLLFILLFSINGYSSAIEVSPIRVYLSNSHPMTSIKLTNKSEQPIYLQLKSMHWTQNSAKDQYEQNNQIIISPPITMIMPGEKQLIRLALRSKTTIDHEDAYRIFIRQIPKYQSDLGINFNLQIGIPLFIEPVTISDKKLDWKVKINQNQLEITAINPSRYHIQLTHLKITSDNKVFISKNIFSYMLPKQQTQFSYPLKNKLGDSINIEALSDWGPIQFRAKV